MIKADWNPARRPARPAASLLQTMQTGHGWTAGGSGTASSNVNDTSDYWLGTQCATVVTNGLGVGQTNLSKTGLAGQSIAGKQIAVTVKVEDVTHLQSITLYAATDSGFTNYYSWALHTKPSVGETLPRSGEWVTLVAPLAGITNGAGTCTRTAGVPDVTTGFTALKVTVFDDGAGAVTWHLGSVEILTDSSPFTNGAVVMSFDDNTDNQLLAKQRMDAYGYRGTLNIIADAVGVSGKLTKRQMLDWQTLGWDVGGHAYSTTVHGNGLTAYNAGQVRADLRELRTWLRTNGFDGNSFAYPLGRFGLTADGRYVSDIVREEGWRIGRTIIGNQPAGLWQPHPMRVQSLTGISSAAGGTTVASLTASGGMLDRVKGNKGVLILCLHQFVTTTPTATTQMLTTDFDTLLAAINSRGMQVLTTEELMSYYG